MFAKPNRRPPGTPKTGGRKKGSGGRRLFLTIPKAQADLLEEYTDNEIRALIITALGKIKKPLLR